MADDTRLDAFTVVATRKCTYCGMESHVRLQRYDREGNRLADMFQTNRDELTSTKKELTEVLAENARLRRKLEKR
jgi:hypothetical protein